MSGGAFPTPQVFRQLALVPRRPYSADAGIKIQAGKHLGDAFGGSFLGADDGMRGQAAHQWRDCQAELDRIESTAKFGEVMDYGFHGGDLAGD